MLLNKYKRFLVSLLTTVYLLGFSMPLVSAEELHIEEKLNLNTLHLSMILDESNYNLEPRRIFNFTDSYFSSTDGVRDLYQYQCNNILLDGGVKFNVRVYRAINEKTAKKYFNEYIDDNKPNEYENSNSNRDSSTFLNIDYNSNTIKKTDTEYFAFNREELIRTWYPGSGATAPLTSSYSIMTPKKAAQWSGAMGFTFGNASSPIEDGDPGEDELGPFIYGEKYSQGSATCQMQYAFFCKDNIFTVVSMYDYGAVRVPYDTLTETHVTNMVNTLIETLEPKIISIKDEIIENFKNLDLDKEGIISGNIATFQPIGNAYIELFLEDGSKYESVTDNSGNFLFDTGKSDEEILKIGKAELKIRLSYNTDKENFRIVYADETIELIKKVEFETKKDMKVNPFERDAEDLLGNVPINGTDDLNMVTAFYIHTAEVFEFYRDKLGFDVSKDRDKDDPITVFVMGEGKSAYFSGADKNIYIPMNRAPYNHPNRPKNREWHEFSHLAMYTIYGKFPGGYTAAEYSSIKNAVDAKTTFRENHAGLKNSSTADSFVEGFAEFIPLVMAKELNYPDPEVYPVGGSLEVNKSAYESLGKGEELALAGILWDLFDSDEDYPNGIDDDGVSISLDGLWNILKTYKNNFKEVYDAVIADFGKTDESKAAIDNIFISHDFFLDSDSGNGACQFNEPYFDGEIKFELSEDEILSAVDTVGLDGVYLTGEEFIDFPVDHDYKEGDPVGAPADQERKYRKEAVSYDGYYIKPIECNNDYYAVYVTFPEIPFYNHYMMVAVNEDGMIPIPVPPEKYISEIQVISGEGESLYIDSADFYASLEKTYQQGYYMEYNFETSDDDEYNIPETDIKSVNYDTGYNLPFYEIIRIAGEEERNIGDVEEEYAEKHSELAGEIKSTSGSNSRTNKAVDPENIKFFGKVAYVLIYALPVLFGIFMIILLFKKKNRIQ